MATVKVTHGCPSHPPGTEGRLVDPSDVRGWKPVAFNDTPEQQKLKSCWFCGNRMVKLEE